MEVRPNWLEHKRRVRADKPEQGPQRLQASTAADVFPKFSIFAHRVLAERK